MEAHVPLESAGAVKLRTMEGWTDVSMFLCFNHQEFRMPTGGQPCLKVLQSDSLTIANHWCDTFGKHERWSIPSAFWMTITIAGPNIFGRNLSPVPTAKRLLGQLWKVALLLYHRPRKWPCPRACWESPRFSNRDHSMKRAGCCNSFNGNV